jgi:UDP:flavonoid glycosyltransferase YjiC (YdhE family)
MRVGGEQVRPGDVLPESVMALPHERTVYLTLGTLFNGAADFAVPLEALRELPVNVVLTCGYDVDPRRLSRCPAASQSSGGCLRHCCCQGAAPSSATPGQAR